MMNATILYSDKDILICSKPSGMLSQADEKGENGLKEHLENTLKRAVFLIHRLDRPVSGLMVFALSSRAAAELSADVADHTKFTKEYLACISGRPSEDTAILKDFLFRDRVSGKTFAVSTPRKGAKTAELEYKRLETIPYGASGEEISLVKVRLYTGRTHQIRAQFSSRGHPIAGDGKYGSRIKCEGIALHSYRLCFKHPRTGKIIDIIRPPGGMEIFENFTESAEITASKTDNQE